MTVVRRRMDRRLVWRQFRLQVKIKRKLKNTAGRAEGRQDGFASPYQPHSLWWSCHWEINTTSTTFFCCVNIHDESKQVKVSAVQKKLRTLETRKISKKENCCTKCANAYWTERQVHRTRPLRSTSAKKKRKTSWILQSIPSQSNQFDLHRGWSQRPQFFRHVLNKHWKLDNTTTLACNSLRVSTSHIMIDNLWNGDVRDLFTNPLRNPLLRDNLGYLNILVE